MRDLLFCPHCQEPMLFVQIVWHYESRARTRGNPTVIDGTVAYTSVAAINPLPGDTTLVSTTAVCDICHEPIDLDAQGWTVTMTEGERTRCLIRRDSAIMEDKL